MNHFNVLINFIINIICIVLFRRTFILHATACVTFYAHSTNDNRETIFISSQEHNLFSTILKTSFTKFRTVCGARSSKQLEINNTLLIICISKPLFNTIIKKLNNIISSFLNYSVV